MTTKAAGVVYLVGAGPGDPGLITRRGLECIRTADVIVYDRLIPPSLLQEARPGARLVYVGKQAASHALPQGEINELLAREARAGRAVCRLKGGDPYIFGRGAEEALYLVERGLAFEEVPGITSGIAAPAYAGIPLTHRELASSVAFVTGQEDADKAESTIDWAGLASGPDTLVFLMGMANLSEIAARLVEHGRSPDTPAALVRMGTTPSQQTVVATLATLVEAGRAAGLTPPVAVVIGEVVRLREQLAWFERRPLFGRRVVVTRARDQASDLTRRLAALGAEAIEFPVIRPVALPAEPATLAQLHTYDWVVFTSANAIGFLLRQLFASGRDVRALGSARIASMGPGTTAALETAGVRVDFQPTRFIAEQVLEQFPEAPPGSRVLIPRAKQARDVLPEGLRARGLHVDVYPVYETVPEAEGATDLRRRFAAGEVDVVCFTSSSTVTNFLAAIGDTPMPPSVALASIGPVTTATAEAAGLRVAIEAQEHSIAGLVAAIAEALTPDTHVPR